MDEVVITCPDRAEAQGYAVMPLTVRRNPKAMPNNASRARPVETDASAAGTIAVDSVEEENACRSEDTVSARN